MTAGADRAVGKGSSPAGGTLLVLCGPSGVGKTTSLAMLQASDPGLWLSVSATTRSRRPGEIDGVHYWFVDDPAFDRLIAQDHLLEWAEFAGNRYGTPRRPVLDRLAAGGCVLLDVNPRGAWQVRDALPQARLVFLAPPSWEELVKRLTSRGTEPPEVVQRRLAAAREELAAEPEFDVRLVNNSVEEVVSELRALLCEPSSWEGGLGGAAHGSARR
jgi:guanylate kinase